MWAWCLNLCHVWVWGRRCSMEFPGWLQQGESKTYKISFQIHKWSDNKLEKTPAIRKILEITVTKPWYTLCIKWSEVKPLSPVWLFATPWTVAYQAPPSKRFSKQEYWSGLPLPSPGDLPDPEIEPRSSALEVDALSSEPPGKSLCIRAYTK